ncbi:aromatic acid exporter family protein [Clostridium grantii]|uniref:Uncharacterized membrane protein YgaE, UPF0421/DUF939 family n=1 Tax=Clostridium grantii DSM 8605 TaxID=1121316 RepID=A0A1M5X0Z0_9CLOT|nr:aromatic acid exporter family protein [Clostridium grantii]SHH93529.1 Uncharacterized membrane protein YgaE, UPF0421/DUF939 family [Clostridium grantii DSM 8605]
MSFIKLNFYRAIKITLGVVLSIVIARLLNLQYDLSAGTIAILSMLDTKRHSPTIAFKRIYTALIALSLSSILFTLLNFSLISFGIFLLLYVSIVFYLNATVGLVVNTVLVTHLFTLSKITPTALINEILLMLIGILIALIFNLHMPNIEEDIRALQLKLENELRSLLREMGANLKNICEINSNPISLDDIKEILKLGKQKSYQHLNSYYFKENNYFVEYFEMRKNQYYTLVYMQKRLQPEFISSYESELLSKFTYKLADEFHECNNGEDLLLELSLLKEVLKDSPLPTSREEFEGRSSLYEYLNDIEEFINIKKSFIELYGDIQYCTITY